MHAHSIVISVQEQDFNVSESTLFDTQPINQQEIGAVVSFVGKARKTEPNANTELLALEIEHYAGMTETAINNICQQAFKQWSLMGCRVIHRVGRINVGENIVLVAVASQHRKDAFLACEFIMDFLKNQAPFWKKAIFHDQEHWVKEKISDKQALKKWDADS